MLSLRNERGKASNFLKLVLNSQTPGTCKSLWTALGELTDWEYNVTQHFPFPR